MRKDVAFASEQFEVSERRACKLMGVDRGSYRYEPRPDRNAQLRLALVELARQKPRYGYRRLHALLVRHDHPVSVCAFTGCIEQKGWRCGGSSASDFRV